MDAIRVVGESCPVLPLCPARTGAAPGQPRWNRRGRMATDEPEYGQVDQIIFRLSAEPDGQVYAWHENGWRPFPMSAQDVRELLGYRLMTREGLVQRGITP